jgi:hypothetical protein
MNCYEIRLLFLTVLFLYVGSTHANNSAYQELVQAYDFVDQPSPKAFSVCYRHSCAQVDVIGLSEPQWQGVRALFPEPAYSAEQERQRIAEAIAYLEREVGPIIHTEHDKRGNIEGFMGDGNQLDCVDESSNSTTYLTLIEQDGLLHWYRTDERATRGFLIFGGWPHTTATIRDRHSGERWAVDSWFHDNGEPPEILPLAKWRDGWSPSQFPGF